MLVENKKEKNGSPDYIDIMEVWKIEKKEVPVSVDGADQDAQLQ